MTADTHVEDSSASSKTVSKRRVGKHLDAIARFILLATVFLLPFFGLPMPGLAISFSKLALLSTGVVLAVFLYLIARLEDGVIVFPKNLLSLSFGLIALVFFISSLSSSTSRFSLLGYGNESGTFATILIACLGAFLLSVYFRGVERILSLFIALLSSFAIVFFLQGGHLFGLDIDFLGLVGTKAASVVGKWNDLALYAGMFVVLGMIAYELFPHSERIRLVAILAIIFSLLLMFLVNFIFAWVLVGAFALVVFIYSFTIGNKMGGYRVLSPAFVVLLCSIILIIASSYVGDILGRVGITSLEVRPSWSATSEVTAEVLKSSPLLGIGPNRFASAWLLHKPAGVNETIFWNADFNAGVGILPTFVATTGLLGGAIFLLFLIVFLYAGYRSIVAASLSVVERGLLLSSYFLAFYLWTVNFFFVPDPALGVFAFLMTGVFIGASVAAGLTETKEISFLKDPRLGFVVVLAVVFLIITTIFGGYVLAQQYRSFMLFRNGILSFNQEGNLDKAEGLFTRAIAGSKQDIYYRGLAEINLVRMNQLATTRDVSADIIRSQFQNVLALAIDNATKATQMNPENYTNWVELARVYEAIVPLRVQGAYEAAISAYDKATRVSPRSPAIPLARARLELGKGDRKAARAKIADALAMKSNYTDALFLLSQIEADDGNVKKAISNAEQASLIDPNDIGIYFQLGLLRYIDEDFDGAIAALERAVAINPQFANAKYFLGLAYSRLGRRSDAITQFENIELTNPDNQEVKIILRNLRAGRAALSGIGSQPTERSEPPVKDKTGKGDE